LQILQSFCQSGFHTLSRSLDPLLSPPPVSIGRSYHAQRLRQVMESSAVNFSFFRCLCLTHAWQTLGHPFPVLWRMVWVRLAFSLIRGLPSSLSASACASLFERLFGTSPRSDSSVCVHAGCMAWRLFPPVCHRFQRRRPGGLPGPCMEFLSVLGIRGRSCRNPERQAKPPVPPRMISTLQAGGTGIQPGGLLPRLLGRFSVGKREFRLSY
jgi:hypothetical protein